LGSCIAASLRLFFRREGRSGVIGSAVRIPDAAELSSARPCSGGVTAAEAQPRESGTTAASTTSPVGGPVPRGVPQSTDDDDDGLESR